MSRACGDGVDPVGQDHMRMGGTLGGWDQIRMGTAVCNKQTLRVGRFRMYGSNLLHPH